MTSERVERRLAAILAGDVAGYSRLMGVDEVGTLEALKAHRREVVEPEIAEHRGRIFKTTGDGILVEFASTVDAVTCAVAIQEKMAERIASGPEPRIRFRIGINVGEIIIDGDDIFGDGVNVAARVENECEPGGVCVSGNAFEQIRGKTKFAFDDLGDRTLKNIERPVRVYAVRGSSSLAIAAVGALSSIGPNSGDPLPLPDRPSIAVLPFQSMSGDPEQGYFVDGITEQIIIALSRVRWFFVIARHSTFSYRHSGMNVKQIARELGVRYVLTGSVRRSDDRIRVSAQLIEGSSGNTVWARSYDRAVSDIFAVQDEMTQTIVGAIEPELGRAERERARIKPRDNLDAWSIYQRGMFHLYRCTCDDLLEARRLFRETVAIDPELGPSYSGEAEAYYYEVVYGFAKSNEENREKAIEPAHRAVTLDGDDAGAHCTLGRIRYLRREYPPAISELEVALELNPSLALAHYGLGAALVFSGQAAQSLHHLQSAIRLSPHDPNMGSFLVRIADAKYFAADYESAVAFALKALGKPNFQWSRYAVLIAALGQLERVAEARRYLAEVTRQRPDFSIAFVRSTHLFGEPDIMAHYCEGLRKAAVPDA